MKRSLSFVLILMLLLGSLVGCGANEEAKPAEEPAEAETTETAEGAAKEEVVYALTTSPSGVFHPLLADSTYDVAVNSLVFASLMTVNPKGEVEPYLATEVNVSEDGKSITYKLADNAKWHDGQPVTAADVEFTLTSMADKDYVGSNFNDVELIKGAKAYHGGEAEAIEGIVVEDEHTITIAFEEESAPAVTNIGTTGIIPKHIWEGVAMGEWEQQTELMNKPVGCGPYALTEFQNDQYVKFEGASDFFLGEPATKSLIFKVINADTTEAEFAAKTIDIADVADLSKDDVKALTDTGLKLVSYPNYMYQYMGFNLRNPILSDVAVRQAFMYAINRKGIVDELIEGRGVVVNVPMLPSGWAYQTGAELNEYPHDVEKAKELLTEAGWADSDGDGILDKDGQNLSFTLLVGKGNVKREQSALIIQENLKEAGINIEIETMDFSALIEQAVTNHDFELYLMGNTLSVDPDPKPFWHSDAVSDEVGVQGYNIVGYRNDEVDALIEKGIAELDQAERAKIYEEYAKILNQDVPQVFLYCQDIEKVYNPGLTNFEPSSFNQFYNIHKWSITE
ncbi:MAG: ABC transporter substrate-binding protein [Tissierellia bacterium]|nr:ABC transporter substrate-binding protein [Tissierellia bacterium]